MSVERIYFDNGSTSFPKAPGVAERMSALLQNGAFNINRGNYEGAYEVAGSVLDTRMLLAKLFHAKSSKQVVFTPGITYSINYLLKGFLKANDHVIISGLEHNAVMRPLHQLKKEGVTYDVIPTDIEGNVAVEKLEELIRKETKLVLVLHASNVCGTVVPIEEIGAICERKGVFFAVDTAQSAGTIPVNMEKAKIDFLAFTGHKGLLGPQGIGGFVISEKLDKELTPLIAGGTGSISDSFETPVTLPDKYECGTMNLPGIIGLGAAVEYIEKESLACIHKRKMELTKYFMEEVKKHADIRIVGRQDLENRVAVISLDFQNRDNALVAFELESEYGIMTRVGLHCAPLAHKTLGTYPQGTVRIAFSASNTIEEINVLMKALKNI